MALAERDLKQQVVLTYEDYLTEGVTPGRYDIVDGVREYMTNPETVHQIIARNINGILVEYEERTESGIALLSPVDIVITKFPLKVRQPDLLYISYERWGDREFSSPAPLSTAPELVVEILSPSESRRKIEKKANEYASVGVIECWLVSPEAQTVEQIKLSSSETERMGLFSGQDMLHSISLPELSVSIDRVFKMPKRPLLKA